MAAERARRWREQDFYAALGLTPSATAADIRRGFHRVALNCHPDKVREQERARATKQFQLIAEAYEVLSDASRRPSYDQVRREAGLKPSAPTGPAAAAAKAAKAQAVGKAPATAKATKAAPAAPAPAAAPARGGLFEAGGLAAGLGLNFGSRGWSRCAGCDNKLPSTDLRRCPRCAAKLCFSCKLCAGCVESEAEDAEPPQRPAAKPAAAPAAAKKPAAPAAKPAAAPPAKPAAQPPPAPKPAPPAPAPVTAPVAMPVPVGVPAAAGPPRPSAEPAAAARAARPVDEEQAEREAETSEDGGEEALDMVEIMMLMGFREEDARFAATRCSSVEAAVQYLMSRDEPPAAAPPRVPLGDEPGGAVDPGHVEVWRRVEADGAPEATGGAEAGAAGLGAAVGRLGEVLTAWTWGGAADAEPPLDHRAKELVAQLLEFGYNEAQANAAAKRCSSMEASVEWLSANPDVER